MITLLKAAAADYQNPKTTIEQLRAQIERLTIEVDDEMRAVGRARLKDVVETPDERFSAMPPAMREVKAGVLSDLRDAPSDAAAFQRWLTDITALYEVWRARFAAR